MPNSDPTEFSGSVSQAILDAASLLVTDPTSTQSDALRILNAAPGQPQALRLFVIACRLSGNLSGARQLLEEMAARAPNVAAIQCELAQVLKDLGDVEAAAAAYARTADLEPDSAEAWGSLAETLAAMGRREPAAQAYAKHLELLCSGFREIEDAALGPNDGLPNAEMLLRKWLEEHPRDVRALQLLGSVYLRLGRYEDAGQQLSKAVDLSPDFADARWMLAGTYLYRGDWEKTLFQADKLLEDAPGKAKYLELRAHALLRLGQPEASVTVYETLLSKSLTADNWKNYGQALKAIGQRGRAIAAYREAISLQPTYGRAYWCLAELKTFRFSPAEVAAMANILKEPTVSEEDRGRIHFALGKALEDQSRYSAAFEEYRKANAIFRPAARQAPEQWRDFVRRRKAVFAPRFFRDRAGWGCPSRSPIFIVGLPRSGTTLVEQILSSHSQIESTSELQLLESIAQRLCAKAGARGKGYPEAMQDVTADEIRAAGEEYLEAVQSYRRLNRPFFLDKMPINFAYLGFIATTFPRAKVIDVRRHPLGTGFGIFRHYFEKAYTFAFDLGDIGRYYRNYVELMAHFDSVLPGRVHRVFYESVVTNTGEEIRKLLDYCGLPFEDACLRFHETRRAVLTPSSEQVRLPIFREGLEQWKVYEEQLEPLKASLGDVLQKYPEPPEFADTDVQSGAAWQISAGSFGSGFVRRHS